MTGIPTSQPKSDEIVVFDNLRDSKCSDCGDDIGRGEFLRLEADHPLCMECADLAHLTFLPRGDAALTRRSSRYSTLRVVVVRFSRSRGRYEREGLLVEEKALEQAERECLADADSRARVRDRRAERDAAIDLQYRADFARHVREMYPGCPEEESVAIAEHACRKYSGRVGRSAEAKRFDAEALGLAVRAHVRHVHTEYDKLLMSGRGRSDARSTVASKIERTLERWSVP